MYPPELGRVYEMEGRVCYVQALCSNPEAPQPSPIRATRFAFLQHLKFSKNYLLRRMFDSRLRATAKIRLTLLLLFPILIVEQTLFCSLGHNLSYGFAKERYNFTINDLVETEPTNTLAKGIGGDTIRKQVEWTRNIVGVNLLVSLIGVRPIFQTIHRVRELTQFGVSDCEFDFL